MDDQKESLNKETDNEQEKKFLKENKHRKLLILMICIISSLILTFLLVLFCMFWQNDYESMMAYCNSFYFSGIILFFFGWIMLMYNWNIFSPILHGTRSMLLRFIGRRPKLDYYEYTQSIKNNPIPKLFLLTPLIASVPSIIVAVILNFIIGF